VLVDFTPDEKTLQRVYKMMTELRANAEKQLQLADRCKGKLESLSKAKSKPASATTDDASGAVRPTTSLTESDGNDLNSSRLDEPPSKKARPTVAHKGPIAGAHTAPRPGELVGAKESRSSDYILATVLQYLPTKQRYVVEDADPTLGPGQKPRQFQCLMSDLLPMRKADVEYPVGTHVYAVFPETSTLYLAEVVQSPSQRADQQYLLSFFDDEDSRGRTPNRLIPPDSVTQKKMIAI